MTLIDFNEIRLRKIIFDLIDKEKNGELEFHTEIKLSNGNITLKLFKILNFNNKNGVMEGITALEDYSSKKEKRKPAIFSIKIEEVKELSCIELGLNVNNKSSPEKNCA